MKSSASAVRVAIKIDRNRYELLSALAALRGKTVEELISIFLANGLNHPAAASSAAGFAYALFSANRRISNIIPIY